MASLDDAFNQLKIANQHLTAIDNDLQTVNASATAVGVDSAGDDGCGASRLQRASTRLVN